MPGPPKSCGFLLSRFSREAFLSSRLSSVCEVQSEGYGRDRRTATAVNRRCSSIQAAFATATSTGPTRRCTGGPPVSGIWVGEGERRRRARLALRDCRAARGCDPRSRGSCCPSARATAHLRVAGCSLWSERGKRTGCQGRCRPHDPARRCGTGPRSRAGRVLPH